MALNRKQAQNVAKKGSDEEYAWENLAKGQHDGRLVMVADLGLQSKEYKGEYKGDFQQLSLGIEILGTGIESEEGDYIPRVLWTKPFYIYEKLDEKSIEYKLFKVFDDSIEEGDIPDWEAVLGTPCIVVVENVKGTGDNKDKVYDNIEDVLVYPAKFVDQVEEAQAEMGIGDSDDLDNFVTKSLRGLAKFVFDKRILTDEQQDEAVEEVEEKPVAKAAKKATKPKAKTTKKVVVEDDEDPFN